MKKCIRLLFALASNMTYVSNSVTLIMTDCDFKLRYNDSELPMSALGNSQNLSLVLKQGPPPYGIRC